MLWPRFENLFLFCDCDNALVMVTSQGKAVARSTRKVMTTCSTMMPTTMTTKISTNFPIRSRTLSKGVDGVLKWQTNDRHVLGKGGDRAESALGTERCRAQVFRIPSMAPASAYKFNQAAICNATQSPMTSHQAK